MTEDRYAGMTTRSGGFITDEEWQERGRQRLGTAPGGPGSTGGVSAPQGPAEGPGDGVPAQTYSTGLPPRGAPPADDPYQGVRTIYSGGYAKGWDR